MNKTTIQMFIATTLVAMVVIHGSEAQETGKAQHHHYRLVDLGTFGGPASYFPNGLDGFLNNHGTAAGWADTAAADPYPGFCIDPNCHVAHAFAWRNGTLTDLGTLPGGASSQAFWISGNGLIAGNSQNGEIDPLIPGLPEIRAVVWKHGHIVDLGTLEGGHESLASAVNSRGQVVGAFNNTIPDPFSMVGDGFQVHAFLWQNAVMQDLGTLGGPDAFAFFVNESGQVSGQTYTDSTASPVTGLPTTVPFLWEQGNILDLGTLGGTSGFPSAMNNRGEVVGLSNLHGDLSFHPFLWTKRRGMQDLGTLGGATGETNWINDAGYIVGKADLPGSSPQNHDGVLWTRNGAKIDLGVLSGDSCSNAYNVNAAGQVVGTSEDRTHCLALIGEHAFLWENGGPMVDLNTLIAPGSELTLTYAVGINDRGEIGGFGVPVGVSPDQYETKGHAYILIPCDQNPPETDGCEREVDAPGSSSERASVASNVRSERPTRSQVRPSFNMRPRTHE